MANNLTEQKYCRAQVLILVMEYRAWTDIN